MRVLGIESSCDETAAAVVESPLKVRSRVVRSQILTHRRYAGVVPEIASREHLLALNTLVDQALSRARLQPNQIDAIGVTAGPGLVGSLLVGHAAAKVLGWCWDRPVYGINHLEGHLLSPMIEYPQVRFPYLGLIVSGGHTDLFLVQGVGKYRRLGGTRDDAAGEAFDKVARYLGLPYPGGPSIERAARRGDARNVPLPVPMLEGTHDFSFSGLKTAVMRLTRKQKRRTEDVAASFQDVVIRVLTEKTMRAMTASGVKRIAVVGGVAANRALKARFEALRAKHGFTLYYPSLALCTDNAVMIAAAALLRLKQRGVRPISLVRPQWPLESACAA